MADTGKIVALVKALGGSVDPEKIKENVDDWLDENITNPDSPPLDRSLSSSSAAAPADMVGELSSDLNDKYDRYEIKSIAGLSLNMFDICPEQYQIYTYDGSDTLKHSVLPSGTTYLCSRIKNTITECTFKILKISASLAVSVATSTQNGAIQYSINSTSNNINRCYTDGTITTLSGIERNSLCRNVVVGDIIKFKRDGTKVAFYLYDNAEWVPIADSEFFDVSQWFAKTGHSAEDVSLGFVSSNSARNDPLINNFTQFEPFGDHFMDYDEVDERLTSLENGYSNPSVVDLFMFMGQSNMAGRGTAGQAPTIIAGAGYEFRAISDPTKLYPITEPFGIDENVQDKIWDYLGDSKAKSGGMVGAFANAYYSYSKKPIVGVSASEGGTRISHWQPNTSRDGDAKDRYDAAVAYLNSNGYTIRHKYILWCQGESDGDDELSKADYETAFITMANAWFARGIEKIFVVKIGNYNGSGATDYSDIMDAQNELCQTVANVVMVSTDFAGMKARDLMKDDFHYTQAAYNEVGEYAGINTALYVNTGKEPTMYDTQNGTLYYSYKN